MYRNILAEMTRNDMTRADLAKKLNLSLPALRKRIAGEMDFKISEIEKLLSMFGNEISYEYLFQKS